MMFEQWCALNGRQSVPAAPSMVAQFVSEIAPLGIEQVWQAVQDISRAHYLIGLADPTLGAPVTLAVNAVANIEPPRSWPKELWQMFHSLPYDVQMFISAQNRQREVVVKAAMQEAAEARKAVGLPKLPKNFFRDAAKAAA